MTDARAISADGTTIIGFGSEWLHWTLATGSIPLPVTANAVSADGSLVVGRGEPTIGFEAVYFTQALGIVGIGNLSGGGDIAEAFGVSGDGTLIVGHGDTASADEAFSWTIGTGIIPLGTCPGGRPAARPGRCQVTGRPSWAKASARRP